MIDSVMYVGIGLLLGCLLGVAFVPFVQNRALAVRRLEGRLPGTKVILGTCLPYTEEENNVEETSSGNGRCRPSDVHGRCRVLHCPRASDEEMQGRRNSADRNDLGTGWTGRVQNPGGRSKAD